MTTKSLDTFESNHLERWLTKEFSHASERNVARDYIFRYIHEFGKIHEDGWPACLRVGKTLVEQKIEDKKG